MENVKKMSLELNIEYLKQSDKTDFDHNLFRTNMIKKYPELFKNHESIFNVSLSKTYNYNRLCSILKLHEQVVNNELSQHDASVKVGEILVNDFVKPVLNNTNNNEMKIEELEDEDE